MDAISEFYQSFLDLSKSNPVAAGVLSLYGAGILAFFIKGMPTKIYNFLKSQLSTSIMLRHVEDESWRNLQVLAFKDFMSWYGSSKWFYYSRRVRLMFTSNSSEPEIGPGYGTHFFFFQGRLYWFNYTKVNEQQGTSRIEKEEISIATIGRSIEPIRKLIASFARSHLNSKDRHIYRTSSEGWYQSNVLADRPMNLLHYSAGVKEKIIKDVRFFLDNPDWYAKRGLAYKLVIVLYGPSGTGKTSLVKAIATEFQLNIAAINVSNTTDTSFSNSIERAPAKSIILMEDFDSNKNLHIRDESVAVKASLIKFDEVDKPKTTNQNGLDLASEYGLSLTTFLNTLQGVGELNGQIIVLTTNRLNIIDPAVYRPSRVDIPIYVGALDLDATNALASIYYPDVEDIDLSDVGNLPGGYICGAFMENKNDYHGFVKSLKEYRAKEGEDAKELLLDDAYKSTR